MHRPQGLASPCDLFGAQTVAKSRFRGMPETWLSSSQLHRIDSHLKWSPQDQLPAISNIVWW